MKNVTLSNILVKRSTLGVFMEKQNRQGCCHIKNLLENLTFGRHFQNFKEPSKPLRGEANLFRI